MYIRLYIILSVKKKIETDPIVLIHLASLSVPEFKTT